MYYFKFIATISTASEIITKKGLCAGRSWRDVMASLCDYYGNDLLNIYLEATDDEEVFLLDDETYDKL